MDEGEVIETGTHDELVAVDGEYAGLWASQTDATDDHKLASADH